jgi:ssDNA-binding Zn-finger/Zn-ribbon topoisomerase 1
MRTKAPICPLCGAKMKVSTNRDGYKVYVCSNREKTGCAAVRPHISEIRKSKRARY